MLQISNTYFMYYFIEKVFTTFNFIASKTFHWLVQKIFDYIIIILFIFFIIGEENTF